MTILQLHKLSLQIANKNLVTALSVKFQSGECWGILGPNGAGKTTLLHTLAGLRKPEQGTVYLENQNLCTLSSKERAKKIGLLPQECLFSFPNTVLDIALMGRHPHQNHWFRHTEEDVKLTQQMLHKMGLLNFSNNNVLQLSGGEKRKLMLTQLLVQNPDIYLLDEPTNHLDVRQKIKVLTFFFSTSKNAK